MQTRFSALPFLASSLAGLALVACGGSTTTPPASSGPATSAPTTPTPTAAPVTLTCPTAAVINAGLGLTVGAPIQTPTTGNAPGDSGVSCRYTSSDFRDEIILVLGTGPVRQDFFTPTEAGERAAAAKQGQTYNVTAVSGVGDKADYITFSKGGGPTEDGILAQSSNSGMIITVVPAVSESQLEAFASQLLG
ncbi:MAG: hypothetical protein WCB51_08920 [Candidatus Dormiibacterota bacterium]